MSFVKKISYFLILQNISKCEMLEVLLGWFCVRSSSPPLRCGGAFSTKNRSAHARVFGLLRDPSYSPYPGHNFYFHTTLNKCPIHLALSQSCINFFGCLCYNPNQSFMIKKKLQPNTSCFFLAAKLMCQQGAIAMTPFSLISVSLHRLEYWQDEVKITRQNHSF